MPSRSADQTKELLGPQNPKTPQRYLIAHSDGGARGNPGPAGYGVVIQDEAGSKIAVLSKYLGHQTNNVAEYQGLIAALEYALAHDGKALQVISDSELLVRQIKGIYKVKNPSLRELHARAQELIGQLDWFSIDHVLRAHNREADDLANAAMDKGIGGPGTARGEAGASPTPASSPAAGTQEFEGTVIRGGLIRLHRGDLPAGTRVQVRVRK
jgi:ribonuclease HI